MVKAKYGIRTETGVVTAVIRSEYGAVTTWFIVITAAVVLFGAVLIDYARVAALNAMADQAVRSSVRSVLSAYDSALYERYGLFGRGGTPSDAIVEQTLRGTLEYEGADGRYRPVAPMVERFQADAASFLGQYDVLKRQIAEEMKVKAPVDFLMDIGTRLGAMSQLAKETAAATEALTKASQLYDQRQQQLLHTIALMKQIASLPAGQLVGDQAAALAAGYSSYLDTRSRANALAQSIAAAANASIGKTSNGSKQAELDLQQEAAALEEDQARLASYREELSRYETSLSTAVAEMGFQADAARLRGKELQQLAAQSLEEADRLNEQIRHAAAQAESNVSTGYDRVAGALDERSLNGTGSSGDSRTIAEIRDSVGQLAFDDEWFVSIRGLLQQLVDDLYTLTDAAYSFMNASQSALSGNEGSGKLMTLAASDIQHTYVSFQQAYVSPGQRISQIEAEIHSSDAAEAERRRDMQAAEASLHEARALLTTVSVNVTASEELLNQYKQVQARYQANRLFNSAVEDAGEDVVHRSRGGAEEQAAASVKLTGGLFDGLADMLTGARNSFYIGEYVVARFRSYAPHWSAVDVGGGTSTVPSYSFADQEVEYMLYGMDAPYANVSAALTEIFGLRFAIRLTEGFLQSRALGHPLLILSGAIMYASQHALADLAELKQRGATKLSKYAHVDIKYNDYLRLFMLLHGGGDKRLSRIAAVIETNTGTDLSRTPAAVIVSADVSMKLLFLPGAMRLLGSSGMLEGRVLNGKYETTKLAGLSYS
ncbi:hypothetical protein [Paenibacillus xylaniclasticus]|uniref:hypothetical protein n=1 Tax=Paenibacillus xylaniclasticus TaxID=588083 RepID=UPI000FDB8969|nr:MULTISPECIES: hypothetical protein [Paenibacillus]GFN32085.1 hypothetical protein PCURB6_23450 [Paenibacillus curdlanolyticus]